MNNLANTEVQRVAEVKNTVVEFLRSHTVRNTEPILLRPRSTQIEFLLTHPTFRHHDSTDLHAMAKSYCKGRIQIASREVAIALLLSCIEAGNDLPIIKNSVPVFKQGRKFR